MIALFGIFPDSATPWKINMERTNHPCRKENNLPNLHEDMFHVNLQGCHSELLVLGPSGSDSDSRSPCVKGILWILRGHPDSKAPKQFGAPKPPITLPETNIALENGWLEDYSPFWKAYFRVELLVSGRVVFHISLNRFCCQAFHAWWPIVWLMACPLPWTPTFPKRRSRGWLRWEDVTK